jgi:DNA-binding SARP family transcriptional activator/tetratricopeptide (TPR) repeat protein
MVLGAVGLRHDGEWHAPPSGLMRALLAALAVATEEVSAAALIESVWRGREDSPREATVAVAVHRLRRWLTAAVGDAARVSLPTSGYLLEITGGSTDLQRFRALATEARRPDLDLAARAGALSEALAVWRGPPLDDVPPRYAQDALVSLLEGERLACTMELGRTLLQLGEPVRAVDLLTATARLHPLDELPQGLLIEALGAAGRQAAALEVYQALRDRLVDELGVEPGPELRRSYLKVLRQESPARPAPDAVRPAPAQLPANVAHFTGREDAVRALDLHTGRHGGPPAGISVVTGTAGVGKTALARHWAHRARDRFPDGQLFVDLRGYADGAPIQPLDVLGTFLRALGVAADRVPAALQEAAAEYRTRLADRRMLVVLDNARSAAQVRPLLPGGASCHVVVTSRDGLTGLVAVEGARQVGLGPLTAGQAGRLLSGLLGERRVRAEPQAARALAESCARLPLALRIVCAELSSRPGTTLADQVAALGDDRLTALALPGDDHPGVAAALGHSYDVLPPVAQRLFRLLGTAPLRDITGPAAAALAGLGPADGQAVLEILANACLIEEQRPGRYAFHDLLREYAARLPEPQREPALTRLLDWYLSRAGAASRLLYPHIWRMEQPDDAEVLTDREEALRWLDDELANLVACVGTGSQAWRIADTLRGYLWHGAHHTEWRVLANAGQDAAVRLGDDRARAVMAQSLAMLAAVRREPDVVERYQQAWELARKCGWREGEAQALGSLGRTHYEQGHPAPAVTYLEQALVITAETGATAGTAATLGNLGNVLADLGQLARAAELHTRALALFRAMGARPASATALNNLARALWAMGRPAQAQPLAEESVELQREAGGGLGEAYAMGVLARIFRALGDHDRALRHARDALVLVQAVDDDAHQAEILNVLGSVHLVRRDDRTALDCYRRAAECAAHAVNPLPGMQALVGMATAEHRLGRWTESYRLLQQALAGSEERGFRLVAGHAWTALADLEVSRNRPDQARVAAEQALIVRRETGHRIADADPDPVLLRLRRRAS